MMLVHINQTDVAERVHNAWLRTVEDGVHTYDIYAEGVSREKVGTKEFADAVVARLGQTPQTLKAVHYKAAEASEASANQSTAAERPRAKKELVGVDVFLDWREGSADQLGETLKQTAGDKLQLQMISNRGVKVWPGGNSETFCSDHWRCRFLPQTEGSSITHDEIVQLLQRIGDGGFDFIKTENLCTFDGERGYSLDQGA
jgi:isocitrate dehydrogenase